MRKLKLIGIQLILFQFILAHSMAQSIVGAEYFIDTDPGKGLGTYIPLAPSTDISSILSVPLSNVSSGVHFLGWRVKNNLGRWSHYESRLFYVLSINNSLPINISEGEWFIDNDPGVGNGSPFSIAGLGQVDMTLPIVLNNVSEGPHTLNIRMKNAQGNWSHYESRLFYVFPLSNVVVEPNLVEIEWFIDVDPGLGNANAVSISPGTNIDLALDITLADVEAGDHYLFIRVKDASGKWTHYEGKLITINPCLPVTETCNNLDDDCDGTIDNGLTFVNYYNDADGDGYGAGIATNACSQPANTVTNNTDCNDNNAAIKPTATEICGNGIDEDCSGSDLLCPSSGNLNATNVLSVGNYGTGSQTTLSVNFGQGADNVESPGAGIDRWYQFTAQSNAIRLQLTGSPTVADDNDIALYDYTTTTGQELIPLDIENDVTPTSLGISTDGGNEVLYYDQLEPGSSYWICVRNLNAVYGSASLRLSYLRGSAMDIGIYTNFTNTFSSTCQNFKCSHRSGASHYTFNVWNGNATQNGPHWIYSTAPTTSSVASTVLQLGRLVGANINNAPVQHTVKVDAHYALKDAFGNTEQVVGYGVTPGVFTMNTEADLNLRTTDRCPVYKRPTSGSLATNRSVCGTSRYIWQLTMTAPTTGMPQSVNGPTGGSRVLAMNTIPGIANNQQYNVSISSLHMDQQTQSNYGTSQCMRTFGFAGSPIIDEGDQENNDQGKQRSTQIQLYPNPNGGERVVLNVNGMEGETMITITDATGRTIEQLTKTIESDYYQQEIMFQQSLCSGLYQITIENGNYRESTRMVVVR
jgi:hypothetical protein